MMQRVKRSDLGTAALQFPDTMRSPVRVVRAEPQEASDRREQRRSLPGDGRADALRGLWRTCPGLVARL